MLSGALQNPRAEARSGFSFALAVLTSSGEPSHSSRWWRAPRLGPDASDRHAGIRWVLHMGLFDFYLSLGLCFWPCAGMGMDSPARGLPRRPF